MSKQEYISIVGARTNNLKNIDLKIKVNAITCISGPSGSGKSSLAFHTLEAESRRRFINSFPSGMKFFQDIPQRPDVDLIEPVLPVWSLPQKNPLLGSRMNVIDLLDLQNQLEKLFFLFGRARCPKDKSLLSVGSWHDEIEKIKVMSGVLHFFIGKSVYLQKVSETVFPSRSYCEKSKKIQSFDHSDELWEVFRIKKTKLSDLESKVKELSSKSDDFIFNVISSDNQKKKIQLYRDVSLGCKLCGYELENNFLSSAHLSPFTGIGSCSDCKGYGSTLIYAKEKLVKDSSLSIRDGAISVMNFSRFNHLIDEMYLCFKKNNIDIDTPFDKLPDRKWKILFEGDNHFIGLNDLLKYLESMRYKKNIRIYIRSLQEEIICKHCEGTRINKDAYSYSLEDLSFGDLLKEKIGNAIIKLQKINENYFKQDKVACKNFKFILTKLKTSKDLGLENLHLNDKAKLITAGEYQRLLLVKYFSHLGSGSLFILDEPTLGLTPNEQRTSFNYLKKLRDQGNTVLVVDHSLIYQKNSDELILMGPGAGERGGLITYQGKYIKSEKPPFVRKFICEADNIIIKGIVDEEGEYDFELPSAGISWFTGEASSLKSKFFINCLAHSIFNKLYSKKHSSNPISFKSIKIPKSIENVELFTVKSLKSNRRSTVGSYIGLSPYLRKKFAGTTLSKDLLLKDGHFSSNSKLGACTTCEGRGFLTVDMKFLEEVVYKCPDCFGKKLKPMYARIKFNGHSFFDSLQQPIEKVFSTITKTSKVQRILKLLRILNLDYLNLDRSLTSLSGGEKQRLKLLLFLIRPPIKSVLMFENLSFGLSLHELFDICNYFQEIVDDGNVILILDPNPIFGEISNHHYEFKNNNTIITNTYVI